ncbi:high-affinity nickel-transporter [Mesorhizobium opportunistum WSM2075]|uniref:Nickel/cobalt efflux system n=2 Tax=Mesorhizobium opportunistum TaxID=593909 RepID=F7YAV0_MESOW|nr:HoxN/HupN/NixA family nickel/cobalt transporter [Mesorhizobium opportunistum]AEH89926.1 high-affinity nickel-transporter [Mesorhizobium opportunistum WSM2075]
MTEAAALTASAMHQEPTARRLPNPFDDRPVRVRTKTVMIYVLLVGANMGAWAWAWVAFCDRPALLGTALLAYMLGLRHAFDADHIAAIDNVVRKLMQEGKAPYATGFFFSLGHSSIVIMASIAIAASATLMQGRLEAFHKWGDLVGTSVSALFLLVVGMANLFILKGIWAAFIRARRGEKIVDEDLDALLAGRGLIARIFRPLFGIVTRSWHMYPIGFLFGLGFDTATEIGLLGISATQATQGISFWSILVFPALFTAGMSIMDTTDSVLMTGAYRWAFVNPMRKLWYNLTITIVSAAIAIFIGGIEALGILADKLGLQGGLWGVVEGIDGSLATFGYVIVAIFLVSWVVSVIVYRAKGYGRLSMENS